MDSIKGQPQLSARQKEILYAFDVIHTYGEDLQLEVLPAETEALLRQCNNILPKVSECHGPITTDTWNGLGNIRDGLLELVEEKLGADHNLPKTLKFDSLDSEEMSELSHNMNTISASVPRSLAEVAKTAIIIIKAVLSCQDSTPGA